MCASLIALKFCLPASGERNSVGRAEPGEGHERPSHFGLETTGRPRKHIFDQCDSFIAAAAGGLGEFERFL
jgi:hypothetical protein